MSTFDAHKNFGYTTITTAPTPATSGTTLVVSDATVFPATPFNVTIWPVGQQPLKTNAEIARVTNISSNTLTIVRTQEGSTARSIIVGDQIANTITAKVITDIESATNQLFAITSTITTTGAQPSLAIPSGSGALVIFSNNATLLTIQGITAGIDGQRLIIFSTGAGNIAVLNQSLSASGANRIICPQGQDQTLLATTSSASFVYDTTASRWRMDAPPSFSNLDFTGTSTAPGTSISGHAVLFYNTTTGSIQASLGTGAFNDISTPPWRDPTVISRWRDIVRN